LRGSRRRRSILDGEFAVFDPQLRSRFEWLRHPDSAAVATPPVLIAFDLLYVKGRDLTRRPLRDRRARLRGVPGRRGLCLPGPPAGPGRPPGWAQVLERGYEGLVAKDEASVYEVGPTRRWLEVKVPGWTDDEDR
jgi:bifunctional non-homologous end joining protein LigD